MATGDTPNQNLFGTNYNPEDEEEKRARLAAQGAIMGAGNIPASAFGQAPAVAPFSMEAAGQVNPMMEQQSIPTESVSNLITNNPFLAAGGTPTTAQPNANVNAKAISMADANNPAFEGMSAPEIISAVNAPNYQTPADDPSFMSTLGSIFYPPGSSGGGGAGLPPTFTPPSSGATQAEGGTDITPVTLESLGLESSGQRIFKEGLAQGGSTQPPPGASALGATQFTSPDSLALPSETVGQVPSVNAFSAENAGQVNPMMRAQSQEQLQAIQNAPTNGLTTVGGASLSEFLSGQAMPEQGFTQAERPLGGRGVTLTPDQMNELSAQREARLDARLPGDQSVSDRDRRAARGGGISMADQTDMAKANARGATPTEVARGNQVANALGVNLETG